MKFLVINVLSMEWLSVVIIIVGLIILYIRYKRGFTNSLYILHRKAYLDYRNYVITGNKSYQRYVKDFCSENIFLVAKTAEELNKKNLNYNIIHELLWQRTDLVSKYFSSPNFSIEDFGRMNKEFTTTNIISELILVQEVKAEIKEKIKIKKNIIGKNNPFGCTLKKEDFIILTECINEVRAFENDISSEELESFFFCKLEGAFKSKNNRIIAYIINSLSLNNYIIEEWQAVMDKHKLVLSRHKEGHLNCSDLSSATYFPPKETKIIDQYIKQLKKKH